MKILNVYLCNRDMVKTNKIKSKSLPTCNLFEFNEHIKRLTNYANDTEFYNNLNVICDTYCLAALNFDYFELFDEINVFGKYSYATFKRKNNKLKLKMGSIINYKVYDYNGIDSHIFTKRIRYGDGLHRILMETNYFHLNVSTDEHVEGNAEKYITEVISPSKTKSMYKSVIIGYEKYRWFHPQEIFDMAIYDGVSVKKFDKKLSNNSIMTNNKNLIDMRVLMAGYTIILTEDIRGYLTTETKKFVKVYLNYKGEICVINSSNKVFDTKDDITIDGDLKTFMIDLYEKTE